MNAFPKDAMASMLATLAGLPTTNVYWQGKTPPFVAPKNGQVQGSLILSITAGRKLGSAADETRTYEEDGTTTVVTSIQRVYTMSIRSEAFGSEAVDRLQDLSVAFESSAVGEQVNGMGIAISSVDNIIPIAGGSNAAVMSVASLDVFFNMTVTRSVNYPASVDPGYIDEVDEPTQDPPITS